MIRRHSSKYERQVEQKKRLQIHLAGEGLYLYRNTMSGSYRLPKPAKDVQGRVLRDVSANMEFVGDSYFKILIGQGIALVRTIEEPVKKEVVIIQSPLAEANKKISELQAELKNARDKLSNTVITEGTKMCDEKLICDQPNRVTVAGTVEQVVVNKNKKLNESGVETQPIDVLINDGPLSGVEILN